MRPQYSLQYCFAPVFALQYTFISSTGLQLMGKLTVFKDGPTTELFFNNLCKKQAQTIFGVYPTNEVEITCVLFAQLSLFTTVRAACAEQ